MGKGTGLGLPLIYGIVKMHKGKIHVTSNDKPVAKASTGTTFKINNSKEVIKDIINCKSEMKPAKPLILIVDDDHGLSLPDESADLKNWV